MAKRVADMTPEELEAYRARNREWQARWRAAHPQDEQAAQGHKRKKMRLVKYGDSRAPSPNGGAALVARYGEEYVRTIAARGGARNALLGDPSAAGRLGGTATLARHGVEHFAKAGRLGAERRIEVFGLRRRKTV
jgi:hypothetical protein